jgi:hypothetical protein
MQLQECPISNSDVTVPNLDDSLDTLDSIPYHNNNLFEVHPNEELEQDIHDQMASNQDKLEDLPTAQSVPSKTFVFPPPISAVESALADIIAIL